MDPPLVHQQEVLGEEQIEAVLHVVRQAQDTKAAKCVPHCRPRGPASLPARGLPSKGAAAAACMRLSSPGVCTPDAWVSPV